MCPISKIMGDSTSNVPETAVAAPESTPDLVPSKHFIAPSVNDDSESKKISTTTVYKNLKAQQSSTNFETKKSEFEVSSTRLLEDIDKKPRVKSASVASAPDNLVERDATPITSIFSVSGAQSRRIYRRQPISTNNIFPILPEAKVSKTEPPAEKCIAPPPITVKDEAKDSGASLSSMQRELRRPSSAFRNPLTGIGISSNDEYKCKGSKRRDGNPVLGSGYDFETAPSTTATTTATTTTSTSSGHQRIPPGGYSHKLW